MKILIYTFFGKIISNLNHLTQINQNFLEFLNKDDLYKKFS
jgi:hypothetical protein